MTGLTYLSVEEAMLLPGLRVAFTVGLPGPWGLAARAILEFKGIGFHAVAQEPGGENRALVQWTGQSSAPVAMLDGEKPRAHWSEILSLAERLAPERPLIPGTPAQRATMFGIAHEICGESGVGASARALLFLSDTSRRPQLPRLMGKYCQGVQIEEARRRLNETVSWLADLLDEQAARGSQYFVGNSFTAADTYWVAFSNMLAPLAEDICHIPDYYRTASDKCRAFLDQPLPDVLIAHRDRVARDHLSIPFLF